MRAASASQSPSPSPLALLLLLLPFLLVEGFVVPPPPLAAATAAAASAAAQQQHHQLAAVGQGNGQQLQYALSLLQLAEGNIGSSSDTFKPIFLGGVFIMFSGVFIAFIVAELLDRADAFDIVGEELGGKAEIEESEALGRAMREKQQEASRQALLMDLGSEGGNVEGSASFEDIVDEYDN